MKIKVEPKKFIDSVKWVTKVLDKKGNNSHILLKVDSDGQSTLSYNGANAFMSVPLEIKSTDFSDEDSSSTSIPIDGAFLQKLVQGLPKTGDIIITGRRGTPLQVTTKTGKFTVPTFKTKIKASPATVCVGETDINDYFDALTRSAKMCGTKENIRHRYVDTVDVSFCEDEKKIRIYSSDSFVSFETYVDYAPTGRSSNQGYLLIPEQYASIAYTSKDYTGVVRILEEIGNSGKTYRGGYEFEDGRIALFPLKDTKRCPLYKVRALDDMQANQTEAEVVVSTSEITSAIRNIDALARGTEDIIISLEDRSLTVSCGENAITVPTIENSEDPSFTEPFDRSTLKKSFLPINSRTVKMSFAKIAVRLNSVSSTDGANILFAVKRYRNES